MSGWVNPWPASIIDVVHGNHSVEYRGDAYDDSWRTRGGPAEVLPLQVVDVTMDWDVDRTPACRGTMTVVRDGAVRWLSPLTRTLWVHVRVRYRDAAGVDLGERLIGAFHVRRVATDYETGEVVIDFATFDQEVANYYAAVNVRV